jgi:hypothetical protein
MKSSSGSPEGELTMNRIASFMRLDFRSLPVLFKIFLSVIVVLSALFPIVDHLQGESATVFALISAWVVMMVIFDLFIISEKNRLETLHAMLPFTRGDIVKARYLFAVCIPAVVMLPPLFLTLLFPDNERTFFYVAGAFLAISAVTAIAYPLHFKFGSEKARAIITVLVVITIFHLILFSYSAKLHAILALLIPSTSAGKAATGLILLFLSYLLSLRIYRTRDL